MPNHSAVAIANEFLKLCGRSSFDQMKIQKLVYISQGWNLAVNGEPLVRDRIEAWDGGPVFRSIWDHIKYYGIGSKSRLLVEPATREPIEEELSDSERKIIHHVWKKYKKFSGEELSVMTHKRGTPWFNSYYGQGRNAIIRDEDIRKHYVSLAMAGRVGNG